MTDKELLEKLNSQLKELNEMLALGDLELLKSSELDTVKHRIEDELKSYLGHFGKIEALKIEKAIPRWRNMSKSGVFLHTEQVNSSLMNLHMLLHELIKAKNGAEQVEPVPVPKLEITGNTINKAIADAKILLSNEEGGATSAIDRMHTVLHGYLKKVCDDTQITYSKEATLNNLLKELKEKHPALNNKNDHVEQVLISMATILDKLNPLRNKSSLAHPNQDLVDEDEAMLIINTVNTLLSYLDSKFSQKN